jgi:hypothetical protein
MAKRLKDIIKINPAPARGVLGVNPMDPWSPKAGLAEDNMLNKFLSSRGINPGFVSKDTKISHAKSSAFLKWKQDHQYEEVEINEDKWLDRFLSSRGVDPKFVTTDRKVSYAKSGEFAKWLRDHQSEEVETEESENIQEVSGMGMRSVGSHTATQSDHDTVKKHLKNLMAIDSDEPTATSAVHRAIKKVSTAGQTSTKSRSREMLSALVQKHHIPIDKEHRALLNREQVENFDEAKKPTSLEKFRQAAAEREKKHDDIEKEMKARHAAGKEDMKGSIDRLEKSLKKEEIIKTATGLINKGKYGTEYKGDIDPGNPKDSKDSNSLNTTRTKNLERGMNVHFGRAGKIKEESGISKTKETSFHKKLDKLVHSTFGKRKDELKMKEETEQVVNEMDTYPHPDSKEGKALMKAFKSSAKKDPTDLNAPGKSPTVKQTTSALLPMLNKSFKKSMKKEETINEVSKSEVEHHFNNWTNSEHAPYNSDAGDDNKVHQSALRYLRSTNVPKENHEKLAMHIADKFHGSGINEGSERIDELKKSTVKSWLKQQPVVPEKKPCMDRKSFNQKVKLRSKSWDRALDRMTGHKPTSEAVFQDPQAATQSPSDGANNPNEVSEKKRQLSKSARMIKSLYKNRKMTEATDGQSGGGISIDSEKIDKGETTYGKKPKIALTDKDANAGENKPDALAVMSGGRTLTGQERDSVEIDPEMKKRPGQPDSGPKQDGKIR